MASPVKGEMMSTFLLSHCGTEGYMAPEVLNRLPYSFPADWWSLGCLLYHMLIGEAPFMVNMAKMTPKKQGKAKTPQKSAKERVKERLRLPNHLTASCHKILRGLLEKEPSERLTSCRGHDFFKGLSWEALHRKVGASPPIVPAAIHGEDLSHFILEGLDEPKTSRGLWTPVGVTTTKVPLLEELAGLEKSLSLLQEGKTTKKERQGLRKRIYEIQESEAYKLDLKTKEEAEFFPEYPNFDFLGHTVSKEEENSVYHHNGGGGGEGGEGGERGERGERGGGYGESSVLIEGVEVSEEGTMGIESIEIAGCGGVESVESVEEDVDINRMVDALVTEALHMAINAAVGSRALDVALEMGAMSLNTTTLQDVKVLDKERGCTVLTTLAVTYMSHQYAWQVAGENDRQSQKRLRKMVFGFVVIFMRHRLGLLFQRWKGTGHSRPPGHQHVARAALPGRVDTCKVDIDVVVVTLRTATTLSA